MAGHEFGESLERGFEAFFCNEPPGLQEAPATVGREHASLERDFAQGDAGALEADFFAGTTEIDEGGGERFRAHEDESHGGEHLLGGGAIGGFVQIDEDIGPVKGNHAGPFPCANERQEMDGDVAEVNVEEARVGGVEDADGFSLFRWRKAARARRAVADTKYGGGSGCRASARRGWDRRGSARLLRASAR